MPPSYSPPISFIRKGVLLQAAPGTNQTQLLGGSDSSAQSTQRLASTNFTLTANWTMGTGWVATSSNVATATAATGDLAATLTNFTPVIGTTYLIFCQVNFSSGTFQFQIGGAISPTMTAIGSIAIYSFMLTAVNATQSFTIHPVTALTGVAGSTFQHPNVKSITAITPAFSELDSTGALAYELRPGLATNQALSSGINSGKYVSGTAQVTGFGSNALSQNTTGAGNIAIGSNALQYHVTGGPNTAIGLNAMQFDQTGISNLAIGGSALQNNIIGNQNAAIGGNALNANTSGGTNIAIGFNADTTGTTGSGKIIIGANLNPPTPTTSNYLNVGNVVIGDTGIKTGRIARQITSGALATIASGSLTAGTQLYTNADADLHVAATFAAAADTVTTALSADNVTFTNLVTSQPNVAGAVLDIPVTVPAGWFVRYTLTGTASIANGTYY